MSQTLYRKYRPQTFARVLGQQSIVKTITNALIHNRVGQAYLFTGPRGTGKTTMARLLAKAVTCTNRDGAEPCLACAHCLAVAQNNSLDIIEIDAASNTGVDNIRELRDSIKLLPTLSTMKVYIIDEVHMLSIGAFNALLKTLEEPPAHVMFILATTSLHKVPDTIVSRCQKFDFSRLPLESIVEKLSGIADDEKVHISQSAVQMIALAAEGGMRDAESLLMQIIHSGDADITEDDVTTQLGISNQQNIQQLLQLLQERNLPSSLLLINDVVHNGVDPYVYTNSLIATLRHILLLHVDENLIKTLDIQLSPEHASTLSQLAKDFSQEHILLMLSLFQKARNEIRSSSIPQLPLELAVANFIQSTRGGSASGANKNTPAQKPAPQPPTNIPPAPKNPSSTKEKSLPQSPIRRIAKTSTKDTSLVAKKSTTNDTYSQVHISPDKPIDSNVIDSQTQASSENIALDVILSNWDAIVDATQKSNSALALSLRNCKPYQILENGLIEISAKFQMYADKINAVENRLTVEQAFDTILKTKTSIKAVVVSETSDGNVSDESAIAMNPLVSDALSILGGEVVV